VKVALFEPGQLTLAIDQLPDAGQGTGSSLGDKVAAKINSSMSVTTERMVKQYGAPNELQEAKLKSILSDFIHGSPYSAALG